MKIPKRDLTFLDRSEFIGLVFHPRKQEGTSQETTNASSLKFEVERKIIIGARFYRTRDYQNAPNLLFFHGNGEIATDYDYIAPMFQNLGINLVVFDYRGYGISTGNPSFSTMLKDAHVLYREIRKYLNVYDFNGSISIMGRSLGSASAFELASSYQKDLNCLIIESGFVNTYALLRRLGIPSTWLPEEKEEESSAYPLIRRINIPTLIIHGERDIIIPLSEGVEIHKNIASEEKELLIIPMAGHNDLLLRGPDDYLEAIHKFILA